MNNTLFGKTILILLFCSFLHPFSTQAARIKDISAIKGVRGNYLYGYGLVIGLSGTGDSSTNVPFVNQSVVSMLSRMNITLSPEKIDALKVKNIASVIITANLPSFARTGNKIDILASSIGDAKSLKGGLLLLTPLKGADGIIYAVAQGPLSVGGNLNNKKKTNHLTVAKIIGGAIVEKEISFNFKGKNSFLLSLFKPDFTTAYRVAQAINNTISADTARPFDAGNIEVKIPIRFRNKKVAFITKIEDIKVVPDVSAKVVIDERTGTVVFGKNVVISTTAISHGNLSIQIKPKVVKASASAGRVRRRAPRRGAKKAGKRVILMKEERNIEDLVNALNAIGVSPDNLITIFQALKAAGALQAELEII